MNEHEKQLNDWLARREREEREERLFEAMKRLLSDPELNDRTSEVCPCCCGRGRLEIILGARDDEERR